MRIKREWDIRDIMLAVILVMMVINFLDGSIVKKADAETFRLDDCITSSPKDKPAAYLHVVTH